MKSISEVTQRYGISRKTLYLYEQNGLIASVRHGSGHIRMYDSAALARLEQTLLLRSAGLSLSEIADVLSGKDIQCLLAQRLSLLEKMIRSAEASRTILSDFLSAKDKNRALPDFISYLRQENERMQTMEKYETEPFLLEIGTDIVPALMPAPDGPFFAGIRQLRESLAAETGITAPLVRVRDTYDIPPGSARLTLQGGRPLVRTPGSQDAESIRTFLLSWVEQGMRDRLLRESRTSPE